MTRRCPPGRAATAHYPAVSAGWAPLPSTPCSSLSAGWAPLPSTPVLVLVRHGQTSLNAEGRLAGRLDVPLTEVGVAQAAAVARAVLASGRPSRVIASPLQRARQTAAAFGLPIEVDERWVEMDYGEYDGRPLGDVPASLWDAWRADPAFMAPGGESLAALGRRVRAACAELMAAEVAAAEATVVVVSHVSPIKAAVAWALGVGDEACWRMFLAPASVSRIAVAGGRPSLHAFNDTAHLRVGVAAGPGATA